MVKQKRSYVDIIIMTSKTVSLRQRGSDDSDTSVPKDYEVREITEKVHEQKPGIIHMLLTIFITNHLINLAFLLGWISSGSTTTERIMRLERKEKKNETPQQNNLQLVLIVIVIVLVIILVMLAISVPLTREIHPIITFIGIIIVICLTVLFVCFLAAN